MIHRTSAIPNGHGILQGRRDILLGLTGGFHEVLALGKITGQRSGEGAAGAMGGASFDLFVRESLVLPPGFPA